MSKKANKKKGKRGRPRHNAERTPSGQKSRANQPMQNMDEVVVEARQRVFGLTLDQARDAHAGSVLGRLFITFENGRRRISAEQRLAGEMFLERWTKAMNAIQAPVGLTVRDARQPMDWNRMGQSDQEQYAVWATNRIGDWEVAKEWIMDFAGANRENDARYAAVEVLRVCIADEEPSNITALRDGLSYLAKRMGIGEQLKEAAE